MESKRIVVVDDSFLCQRVLSDVINARKCLEVAAVASNGEDGLLQIEKLQPDLVILDVLMPELDGIQTLIRIRKEWPQIKTIMFSALNVEGSETAMDALALGASDFSAKPNPMGTSEQVRQKLNEELVPKIEVLCGVEPKQFADLPINRSKHESRIINTKRRSVNTAVGNSDNLDIWLIAIGVSTGGPDALSVLLSDLPVDIGVPVVIVQHMPAEFTAKLARRLDKVSPLKVVEAQLGDKLQKGTVYIAPGDFHMTLDRIGTDVIVNLNREAPENSCRPAVDPLFRSIPALYGNHCLGIIMTGMGSDGLKGCEVLRAANCPVIVQDEATSVVWGMPKLVSMAGLAMQEIALDNMGGVVAEMVGASSRFRRNESANSAVYKQVGNKGRSA